ncbi:MAG: phenylalanine--tRNA ligase subunit beta, partial [Oscillospiraceae bacterium]|nr:phenylalanine--tRNA ligase subunit beta [Oscillospiraceae bacterium]
MIVSMNWIKEFVDLRGLDELELIQRFTLSTAEVEQVIPKGRDVTGVVAGKILRVEKHPDSKKLHLLQVSAGAGGIYDVVCGAPNVREGLVVPFAPLGARLGELEITAAKIAGFVSHGMCCSEKELGISEDHSGLMELPADAPLGADIKTLFGLEDIVFEVDNKSLTNRPDLWGHYGIAREFAVLAGRELKPFAQAGCSKYEALEPIEIQIETEDCLRYSGIKIRHITKTLSPVDMRIRLFYCGMRSINLLADLTNYVMLELSQPMHAFDIRKADRIEVRKFDEPFVFSTLDGTERSIDPAAMMICANGRPLAVAGVMGGLDSEIVEDTDGLLLESANFDPVSIRKTSTRLGLRTDASMRYEKTLDPELTIAGIRRFLKLLMDIDPGVEVISSLSDNYARRYPEIAFSFSKAYVDRCTGIDIPRGTILKTLAGLGFAPRLEEDEFHITVPSWRATKDISIKADMIEEITRVYGYDNFELKSAGVVLAPVRASEQKSCGNAVKDILVRRCHLHEVHSYLWHDAEKCKKLGLAIEENVKIVNSVDSVNSTLRGSMIPTLLCALYDNQGFGASYGLFEIGSVAEGLTADGLCNERRKLGIALYSREATERALFYRLK